MDFNINLKTGVKIGLTIMAQTVIICKLLADDVKTKIKLNEANRHTKDLEERIELYRISNDTLLREIEFYERSQR